MNSRGQALLESIWVILFMVGLCAGLLRMAYITWADLVIDRETHKLAMCTLRERQSRTCEKKSRERLNLLLFKFGSLKRVEGKFQKSLAGYYGASAHIHFIAPFGSVRIRRTVDESQIAAASRRWRF